MATKDRTALKNDFANGKYATGEKFADLIDSMKVVQLPVVDPQALGTSLSFIDSISQDADGKITATKKTVMPTAGAFRFVANDATAEAALTTYGATYSSAISGASPSADTTGVILLMNDDDTTPTKTMMIATQSDGTDGYQFVYVGDLQSAIPSNVLTKNDIVDNFSGGANKVLSAEAGAKINNHLKDSNQIFAIENDLQINATPITLSNRGQYVSLTGTKVTEGTENWIQSQPITVSKGQVVVVYGASTGNGTIIALTDEEETFYTPVIIANDTIKPHFYKVVEDGYIVVQCFYLKFNSAFIVNDSPRINDILEKIATLNETRNEDRGNLGSLLFDYKLKTNEWIFEYGNLSWEGANEGNNLKYFMRTRDFLSTENVGLIKVPQGLKFNRVCYYDSNHVCKLQESTNLTSEYEVKTTYPYFRFSIINVSGTAPINLGQTIPDKIDEVEDQIGAITNVDTFTFDIVGDQYGFNSKSINYNFVNGEMYHVSIETLDNRYETYLSVKDTSGKTLIGSIIRGKGIRDGYFTCDVDNGTKLYMTVAPAYATSTYVVKINKVVKSVDDRINQIEPISSPSYALAEKQRVYNELIDRVNANAALFAFNTDQHLSHNNNGDTKLGKRWVLEGAKMLDELAYELPIDLVVLGGDSAGYYDNQVPIILKGINDLTNTFQRCKCLVGIPGNHEAFQNTANNENNKKITPKAMYNTYGKINSFNPKFVSSNNTDVCVCNGYIDDAYHKIRYIFVDIYSGYENGNEAYRINICSTFLEQALNSMGDDYNAIIMSHAPLTTEFNGIVTIEDASTHATQDAFTNPFGLQSVLNAHSQNIIACICGHSHADVYAYSQTSGILYIETTCALPDSKYLFDNIPFNRTLSAFSNAPSYAPSYPWLTAYDIFVVNQEEKTIEALRYGQGTNRKWRYKDNGTNPAGFISYKNCVNGYIMNGTTPVTTAVVFTNTNDATDEVSVTPNSTGFFETYLTLNATYNITCSGFTLDVLSVTMDGNKSLNIKATPIT